MYYIKVDTYLILLKLKNILKLINGTYFDFRFWESYESIIFTIIYIYIYICDCNQIIMIWNIFMIDFSKNLIQWSNSNLLLVVSRYFSRLKVELLIHFKKGKINNYGKKVEYLSYLYTSYLQNWFF